MNIYEQLTGCISHLSTTWKKEYALFLTSEQLQFFSQRLYRAMYLPQEIPILPYFVEEIPQDYSESVEILRHYFSDDGRTLPQLAQLLEKLPFEDILSIMGQRITPASVRDSSAIPPSKSILLASCFTPYNAHTSIVVRAWEKHIGRHANSILGQIKGNQKEKEATVRQLVIHILSEQTWWNTFGHYKHGNVYEVRLANGQGLRWSSDGKKFIGFLEEFLDSDEE